MHCLSRVQELHPRLEPVQKPRGKAFHFLPEPSARDLRRLSGIVRSGIPERVNGRNPASSARAAENETSELSNDDREVARAREALKATPAPGSPGKIRRTRCVTPAKRRATPNMKSNGHDTSTAKVNGHGPVSPSRTAQETEAPLQKGRAASDDARDFPTAAAASSAAAGTERDACAEVAPSPEGGTNRPAQAQGKQGRVRERRASQAKKTGLRTKARKIRWIFRLARNLCPGMGLGLWMPCTHTWISTSLAHAS